MKTINIKGKEYVPVVERVKEAHLQDKELSITTEIIGEDINRVVVKATIVFKGKTFTGHSQAVYGKGMMGDVALEIAETSAIGRALGFANIGLLDGIASADEMRKVSKPKGVVEQEDVPF
jgi:hypothetical protein